MKNDHLRKMLWLLPIILTLAFCIGCGKSKQKQTPDEGVQTLMVEDPLTDGPCIVESVSLEMPNTGMIQVIVRSMYPSIKTREKVSSLEIASATLQLKRGDRVLIEEGLAINPENNEHTRPFRLVSVDPRWAEEAKAQRRIDLRAEQVALETLDQLRKSLVEKPAE